MENVSDKMDALMKSLAQKKREGKQPQDTEAAAAGMLEALRGDQAPDEDAQHTAPAFVPSDTGTGGSEDARTKMLRCLWWDS